MAHEKRPSKTVTDQQELEEIAAAAKLRSWSELTEEATNLPPALAAALSTGRPELIKLAPTGAPLSAEQAADLYRFIGILIETNMALQRHAKQVEQMASDAWSQYKGLMSMMARLEDFAGFNDRSAEGR